MQSVHLFYISVYNSTCIYSTSTHDAIAHALRNVVLSCECKRIDLDSLLVCGGENLFYHNPINDYPPIPTLVTRLRSATVDPRVGKTKGGYRDGKL